MNQLSEILASDQSAAVLALANLVYLTIFAALALLSFGLRRQPSSRFLLSVGLVLLVLAVEYLVRLYSHLGSDVDLVWVQTHTSIAFAGLLLLASAQILRVKQRGERPSLSRKYRVAAAIAGAGGLAAVAHAWLAYAGDAGHAELTAQRVLNTIAPGTTLAVFGAVFWSYFRATRSHLGQWLGISVIAYGVLQFTEPLDPRWGGLLLLALILKTLFAFSVVLLGMTISDRERIIEYFDRTDLGICLCHHDGSSAMAIRVPNRKMRAILRAAQQPADPSVARPDRKAENQADTAGLPASLSDADFSELWGRPLARHAAESPTRSLDFLASFQRHNALYRFFLVPAPHYFMGTSHLLLAYELDSILGALSDISVGLMIVGNPKDGPERSRVDLPILWCNRYLEGLLGAGQQQLTGTPLSDLIHPDWRGYLTDEPTSPTTDDLVAMTPIGDDTPQNLLVRLTTCILPAPGNPSTQLYLALVTDRENATHTHTQVLLRNFQHNLRNPLESLDASLRSMRHDSSLPDDDLLALQAKVKRIARVVQLNLQVGRDLARGEHESTGRPLRDVLDRIRDHYTEHSPRELVDILGGDPVTLERVRADDHTYLDVELAPPELVIDEPSALEVVLIELIDNALRRCDQARPRLAVQRTGRSDSASDTWVELTVTNDLCGDPRWIELCDQGRRSALSQGLACVRLISTRRGWRIHTSVEREPAPRFCATLALPCRVLEPTDPA